MSTQPLRELTILFEGLGPTISSRSSRGFNALFCTLWTLRHLGAEAGGLLTLEKHGLHSKTVSKIRTIFTYQHGSVYFLNCQVKCYAFTVDNVLT